MFQESLFFYILIFILFKFQVHVLHFQNLKIIINHIFIIIKLLYFYVYYFHYTYYFYYWDLNKLELSFYYSQRIKYFLNQEYMIIPILPLPQHTQKKIVFSIFQKTSFIPINLFNNLIKKLYNDNIWCVDLSKTVFKLFPLEFKYSR